MRRAGWAALVLAGATGVFALLSVYVASWATTGVVDGLTTLVPVPVAFICGFAWRREVGLVAVSWMAATAEVTTGTVNPFVLVVTFAPWLVGAVLRDRQHINRQLNEVGLELEAESQRLADEAVRLERAHIARELHDVVAHCVSVMVVQAYAGERLADTDQTSAAEAFDHITDVAAQATYEIAALVDLLGDEPVTEAERHLDSDLRTLVAGACAIGLQIRLHLDGDPDELPPQAAAVAYRVVQESVTNALKHSPGAPVDISVDCGSEVSIDVVNTLTAPASFPLAVSGGGRGLPGLQARVTRLGGSFAAGPDVPGGWRVSVRFPAG